MWPAAGFEGQSSAARSWTPGLVWETLIKIQFRLQTTPEGRETRWATCGGQWVKSVIKSMIGLISETRQ